MRPPTVLPTDYKNAFKDADIRGLYPTEVSEELAYLVARAFVDITGAKRVAVGRDMRLSSPQMAEAFCAGVVDAGATALDLGLISTPMLYYVSGKQKVHGVMVTASHNPKNYNGLKLVLPGAVPLTGKTGLNAIQKRVAKQHYLEPKKRGKVVTKAIVEDFYAYIQKKFTPPKQRSVKIVVDAGNGMGALLVPLLETYAQVTPLFTVLDGTFPNRDSNPTLKKSQRAIVAALKTGQYDIGVSFDGDADRVAIFDERGHYINAAHIGALLASQLLATTPQATFVHTVFTSRAYVDTIKEQGGKAVMAKVGHAFIKETMRKHDALFGCEHSAHFYFKDNFYTDSVVMVVLQLLQSVAVGKVLEQPFSKTIAPYTAYFQTEEVLVEVSDRAATLVAVAQWAEKQKATIRLNDGVAISTDGWWAHIKKSVTEDAVKFVVESKNKKMAEAKAREILAVVQTTR